MDVELEDLILASSPLGDGLIRTELSVPGVKCAGCIQSIEDGLMNSPGVVLARVNLSTKRVTVDWRKSTITSTPIDILRDIGFEAYLSAGGKIGPDKDVRRLIRALAVAGFGAANIMMLSVGVWAGASPETRALFHWLSAAIALPVMIYSGSVFFSSAWAALRAGRTNMDVPISVGVTLTFAMSAYDTITGGSHAYFDAATSLVFFLLIGRTLDHVARAKARSAITGLQKLAPEGAAVIQPDDSAKHVPLDQIRPGMMLHIPVGGRVPVNGTIIEGRSDIDDSIINGESAPRRAQAGDTALAGALNLTGPIILEATSTSSDSFVSEMIRLMEKAETARNRYQRIADRISRYYTPVVHFGAIFAFLFWFLITANVHHALTVAVSTLIITCPCALGLAVPMVQVMAAQRLARDGILIKDGAALEKLSEIGAVFFDKTGTLTDGTPQFVCPGRIDADTLELAGAIASHSQHPYSRALIQANPQVSFPRLQTDQISEYPGDGIEAVINGTTYRLGRPGWAASNETAPDQRCNANVVLGSKGRKLASFAFVDTLDPAARGVMENLNRRGLSVEILSGDHIATVAAIAGQLGGVRFSAGLRPEDKLARITEAEQQGKKALMIGDGVNDAPALAAAHVSMAPASAADIGRTAADIVYMSDRIDAITNTLAVAERARSLMRQNIAMAIIYNALAVPLAFFGIVTPLVAAIAMSSSSIIVVLNSLRMSAGPSQARRLSLQRRNVRPSPQQLTERVA